LSDELSKFKIEKVKHGINFVGYRTWRTHKLVRKYSMYKFTRACKKKKIESLVSMIGHASNTQSIKSYTEKMRDYGIVELLPKKVAKLAIFKGQAK